MSIHVRISAVLTVLVGVHFVACISDLFQTEAEELFSWLIRRTQERLCVNLNSCTSRQSLHKNELPSATNKLDSTLQFVQPIDTPKTGCKILFWVLCGAFSFFSQHPCTEKPSLLAHIKSFNKHKIFFVCLWLIYGHLPTFRWQVLDIKRAELPRGPLCGFRWRLESLLNLHCNEWLGSASAGERCRNSVTASLWTSGEGGLRARLCVGRVGAGEHLWGSDCQWQQLCGDDRWVRLMGAVVSIGLKKEMQVYCTVYCIL